MGRFHHSSDSDYEPVEVEKPKGRKKRKSIEKVPNKKEQPRNLEKKVKFITKAEKYPLLSNYLRLYFPKERVLDYYLSLIGEEDAASFEDSWDKIYHSELYITVEMELLRDRFRHLILKHLKPHTD